MTKTEIDNLNIRPKKENQFLCSKRSKPHFPSISREKYKKLKITFHNFKALNELKDENLPDFVN